MFVGGPFKRINPWVMHIWLPCCIWTGSDGILSSLILWRCVDQLQCWLDVDCMDSLSLPLFMPSTLLSMPAIMVPQLTAAGYAKPLSLIQVHGCHHTDTTNNSSILEKLHVHFLNRKSWGFVGFWQLSTCIPFNLSSSWEKSNKYLCSCLYEEDTDDQSERAEHGWLKSEPYSQRMKELKMQILASQEEDLACSLKLTSLLNIVEDWLFFPTDGKLIDWGLVHQNVLCFNLLIFRFLFQIGRASCRERV